MRALRTMKRITTKAAITPACLSLCRSALGFVSPALQQPSGHRRPQLPTPSRGTAAAAIVVAVVAPLPLTLSGSFANLPWGPKATKADEASPQGSEGLALGEMSSPSDDRHGPPSKRNRGFITEELSKWESCERGSMLDIASGTGCHVEAFAKALPGWTFQPSEYDETLIPEIVTTVELCGFTNILPPVQLDVRSDPATWPRPATNSEGAGGGGGALWDAAMCINMIHIAPQECTLGLLKGAAAVLKMGKHFFLYGPFELDGVLIPDSNKEFDESLKARSQGLWGIRDVAWVAKLADEQGLELTAMTLMPANNFFVVFTKVRDAALSTEETTSSDVRASRVAERVSAVVRPAREAVVANVAGK